MGFTFNPFTGNFDVVINGAIPQVNTQADLPPATSNTGKTIQVLNNTGVWPYTLGFGTQKGYFRSDGTNWIKVEVSAEVIQNQIDIASATDRDRANHTGTQPISTIDNLQTSLDNKSDVGHTHTESDITDLNKYTQNEVDTLLAGKANTSHTHVIADVTGLQTELDNKLESDDIADFETTTQLNARDAANRDRTNHTGTQVASTISDFANTVRGTVLTGLSLALNAPIVAADNIIIAFGKLQAQINSILTSLSNKLEATDIDTLAELNTIITDADLIDTNDSRLSDNRDPNPHTHVEADITDLDKYTQTEVDALLDTKPNLNVGNVNIYVAPDAGSAQPGDFIGGVGIRDAFREATKYIVQNPTSFIRIYLRDGEYTLVQPIECSHPQAKKAVQLRALNLQNAANMTSLESSLVMNDQVADDAALAAAYNVIINCPSYGAFFDKGSGIETIDSIMFRYTGSNTSRAAIYCAQQGQASIVRCATIGFPYAIRALEFSSTGIVTGNLFLYCNITTLRAEEMSVIRVTQGIGYPVRFHSVTSYTVYALTKAYIRVVASSAGRISIYNDTTNRACFYAASQSTMLTTRVDLFGGNQGWLVTNNSDCTINGNPTVTGNNSYAVHVDRNSSALVTGLTGDPTGTATQQTVFAENNSFIEETGTHTNITFNPTPGSATDSSNIV